GSLFTPADVTGASFRQQTERQYGADAETVLKLYPFTNDQEARAAQAASMRDRTFGWEMRTWARLQTQTGKSKVFMYYLSHVPPPPGWARSTARRFRTRSTGPTANTAQWCRGPRPTRNSLSRCRPTG